LLPPPSEPGPGAARFRRSAGASTTGISLAFVAGALGCRAHLVFSDAFSVVAALRVAERLEPGRTVATVVVDSGLRYVSTDVFQDA